MGKKTEYIKIQNFTTNGDLGIGLDVVKEITKQAVKDVEGASLGNSSHSVFGKQPIEVKISKRGEIFVEVSINVEYGYNVGVICSRVQEKIEHDMLYMTETVPTKIDVSVADVSL